MIRFLILVLVVAVIAPGDAFARRKKGKRGVHRAHRAAAVASGGKRVAIVAPGDGGVVAPPLVVKIARALKAHRMTPVAGPVVRKAVGTDLPTTDEGWAQAAARLNADAIVEAVMVQKGTTHRLFIVVHNGADGTAAARETFAGKGSPKKLVASVGAQFWMKFGSAIAETRKGEGSAMPARDLAATDSDARGGQRTPEPEPARVDESERESRVAVGDDEEKPRKKKKSRRKESEEDETSFEDGAEVDEGGGDDEGEEEESVSTRGELRVAEIELDMRALRRTYQYSPSSAAKPYELKVALLVGGQAFWYPTKYAGVFARGEWTASLKSGPYPTVTRELILGAQARYPFSAGQVHVNAAYFQHLFWIQDSPATNDAARSTLTTPNVTYQGLRLGGGGRFYLDEHMLLGAEAGYRLVTSPGTGTNQIRSAAYFPTASPFMAFDVAAFFGYKIVDFLEARVSIDYRRYVFGMQTGASLTVAGISDDFMAFNLGLVGVLGGK